MNFKDKLSRLNMSSRARASDAQPESSQGEAERVVPSSELSADLTREQERAPAQSWAKEPLAPGRSDRIAQLKSQLAVMHARTLKREARIVPSRGTQDGRTTSFVEALWGDAERVVHDHERARGPLPGEVEQTPVGPLRRVFTRLPEDHRHGNIPVALALASDARDLSILALDPTLEDIDFTRALYIDTETTGLAGGSGTLPFLIGMAFFEGAQLVVEQLVLERPGLEGPMLMRLAERLAEASCVVSYNGKSFDWPLLRTRFVLNRVPAPPLKAHLDLLHCARRVYKRRLGAVRLVHLEEEVLGFTRLDDIPGSLIPETYLRFLRGQVEGAALSPIIEHNRSDLIALSAILGELVRRFRGEVAAQDARDQLGFASVAARAEAHERALAFARGAVEADVRGELSPEALLLAGELKQRRGELEEAITDYRQALEFAHASKLHCARAHLALAKLLEHKLRDFEQALFHARHTAPVEGEDACARRIARLEKRMGTKPLRLLG